MLKINDFVELRLHLCSYVLNFQLFIVNDERPGSFYRSQMELFSDKFP